RRPFTFARKPSIGWCRWTSPTTVPARRTASTRSTRKPKRPTVNERGCEAARLVAGCRVRRGRAVRHSRVRAGRDGKIARRERRATAILAGLLGCGKPGGNDDKRHVAAFRKEC